MHAAIKLLDPSFVSKLYDATQSTVVHIRVFGLLVLGVKGWQQ